MTFKYALAAVTAVSLTTLMGLILMGGAGLLAKRNKSIQ